MEKKTTWLPVYKGFFCSDGSGFYQNWQRLWIGAQIIFEQKDLRCGVPDLHQLKTWLWQLNTGSDKVLRRIKEVFQGMVEIVHESQKGFSVSLLPGDRFIFLKNELFQLRGASLLLREQGLLSQSFLVPCHEVYLHGEETAGGRTKRLMRTVQPVGESERRCVCFFAELWTRAGNAVEMEEKAIFRVEQDFAFFFVKKLRGVLEELGAGAQAWVMATFKLSSLKFFPHCVHNWEYVVQTLQSKLVFHPLKSCFEEQTHALRKRGRSVAERMGVVEAKVENGLLSIRERGGLRLGKEESDSDEEREREWAREKGKASEFEARCRARGVALKRFKAEALTLGNIKVETKLMSKKQVAFSESIPLIAKMDSGADISPFVRKGEYLVALWKCLGEDVGGILGTNEKSLEKAANFLFDKAKSFWEKFDFSQKKITEEDYTLGAEKYRVEEKVIRLLQTLEAYGAYLSHFQEFHDRIAREGRKWVIRTKTAKVPAKLQEQMRFQCPAVGGHWIEVYKQFKIDCVLQKIGQAPQLSKSTTYRLRVMEGTYQSWCKNHNGVLGKRDSAIVRVARVGRKLGEPSCIPHLCIGFQKFQVYDEIALNEFVGEGYYAKEVDIEEESKVICLKNTMLALFEKGSDGVVQDLIEGREVFFPPKKGAVLSVETKAGRRHIEARDKNAWKIAKEGAQSVGEELKIGVATGEIVTDMNSTFAYVPAWVEGVLKRPEDMFSYDIFVKFPWKKGTLIATLEMKGEGAENIWGPLKKLYQQLLGVKVERAVKRFFESEGASGKP